MDAARVEGAVDVLVNRGDGEVGIVVAVEIPDSQGRSEDVLGFGLVRDAGAVLGPELAAGRGQAGG
jgi:hypothetical protein